MILDYIKKIFRESINIAKLFFSLFFTLILLFLTYIYHNSTYTDTSVNELVTELQINIGSNFIDRKNEKEALENVVFINTANEKELVDAFDKYGEKKGNIDITDRGKLAAFFKKLKHTHKIIYISVFFDNNYESKSDSILAVELARIPNVLLSAKIKSDSLIHSKFQKKFGIPSFENFIGTNRFTKYTYRIKDTLKSVPLVLYEAIDNISIDKIGSFYYSNGELCLNSLIINHIIKPVERYNQNNDKIFFDLGEDILSQEKGMSDEELNEIVKDKIVLIGDFEDRNKYRTIYGEISGILLTYNAYLDLKAKNHIIPRSLILLLFSCYFLFILICFFRKNNTIKFINKYLQNDKVILKVFIDFLKNFIGVSLLLIFLSIIVFILYGIHIEIVGMTLMFTTIPYVIKIVKYLFNKNFNYDINKQA